MKVNESMKSIYVGSDIREARTQQQEAGKKNNGNSIFSGNLNLVPDAIMNKKQEAQKKAMDIIKNANKSVSSIDDMLTERQERIKELEADSTAKLQEMSKIDDQMNEIKAQYGVQDDSKEQKDLDLLLKEQESLKPGSQVTLSQEEKDEIANMGETTDYQKQALDLNEGRLKYKYEVKQNAMETSANKKTISAITIEAGKTHEMVDANVEADKLLKESAKDAAAALLDEAKEHVDDKMEETVEEAKENAEEKKEEKEKLEEAKEEREAAEQKSNPVSTTKEATVVDAQDTTQMVNVQNQIKKIVQEDLLLDEDLKGIQIDSEL